MILTTETPLISVIITCYNSDKYIAQTISCVLNQTYAYIELIIVNDGSTDSSEEIILSFDDNRIKYFLTENQGQSKASNFGLAKSKGRYIKFLDSDDIINPVHIESQLKKIHGRPNALSSCSWGRFYDENPLSAIFNRESVWQDLPSITWLKMALSQKNDMMGICLWLIPKSVLDKVGGWNESLTLNNDFEFSVRLLTSVNEVLFAQNAFLYYRSGLPTSLSSIISEKAFSSAILSTDLGCKYFLHKENSAYTRLLCANRYQNWLYRIYPNFPKYCIYIENKIKELGGSDRKIEGGFFFLFVSDMFGWKIAKKLKFHVQNLRMGRFN